MQENKCLKFLQRLPYQTVVSTLQRNLPQTTTAFRPSGLQPQSQERYVIVYNLLSTLVWRAQYAAAVSSRTFMHLQVLSYINNLQVYRARLPLHEHFRFIRYCHLLDDMTALIFHMNCESHKALVGRIPVPN